MSRSRQTFNPRCGRCFTSMTCAWSPTDRTSVMDYPGPRIGIGADGRLDFSDAYAKGGVGRWDRYTIDWRPGLVSWSVDGRIVHERAGWDPTPLPHLPMRLYANLWAPRSEELAG